MPRPKNTPFHRSIHSPGVVVGGKRRVTRTQIVESEGAKAKRNLDRLRQDYLERHPELRR